MSVSPRKKLAKEKAKQDRKRTKWETRALSVATDYAGALNYLLAESGHQPDADPLNRDQLLRINPHSLALAAVTCEVDGVKLMADGTAEIDGQLLDLRDWGFDMDQQLAAERYNSGTLEFFIKQ
jgi:hypothetical protein